jgi:hypothetical protein
MKFFATYQFDQTSHACSLASNVNDVKALRFSTRLKYIGDHKFELYDTQMQSWLRKDTPTDMKTHDGSNGGIPYFEQEEDGNGQVMTLGVDI